MIKKSLFLFFGMMFFTRLLYASASLVAQTYCATPDSNENTCQTASGCGGGSANCGGDINTTGATEIVACVSSYDMTNRYGTTQVPIDNKSNTFLRISGSAALNSQSGVTCYHITSPSVGSGHQFTCGTSATTSYCQMWVWAFKDTDTGVGIRNSSTNTSGAGSTISASGSVGQSGDAVVAVVANNLNTTEPGDQGINNSFNLASRCFGYVGSNHTAGCGAYKIATGAEQPQWSNLNSSSGDNDLATASVAVAASGGSVATLAPQRLLQGVGQ